MSLTILPEGIKREFLASYERVARNHALGFMHELSLDQTCRNRHSIRNFLQKIGYLPPASTGGLGGNKPGPNVETPRRT